MKIELPKATNIADHWVGVVLSLEFTDPDWKRFSKWQLENECFPERVFISGAGRHRAIWDPDDANNVVQFVENLKATT